MKAVIKTATFNKEFENKFGLMYSFKITYNDRVGFYTCKKKEQTHFIAGQEAEFTEEEKETTKGKMLILKPISDNKFNSNWNRALKKEQSKYSGFACAYAKDLVVAGKVEIKELPKYTEALFNLMVRLDKTLEA